VAGNYIGVPGPGLSGSQDMGVGYIPYIDIIVSPIYNKFIVSLHIIYKELPHQGYPVIIRAYKTGGAEHYCIQPVRAGLKDFQAGGCFAPVICALGI